MIYHTYLDNRYKEDQVKQMLSANSSSKTIKNFITDDEVALLRKQINKVKYAEIGKTSKYHGASYADTTGVVLKKIFHERIKKLIGEYELDFFAWQEAITPWKIHADIRWYADKLPYKVILVPLDVISEQESWKDTYTFTFKQRDYLEANRNTGKGQKANTDQSTWKRPYDNPGTKHLCEGYKISKDEHKKYFSHMPYEFLKGLEIDNMFKWTPGRCVIWDQNQLHCADNFLQNNIQTKKSLIFFTNQAKSQS